jgi:hypothetical protein
MPLLRHPQPPQAAHRTQQRVAMDVRTRQHVKLDRRQDGVRKRSTKAIRIPGKKSEQKLIELGSEMQLELVISVK